MAQIFWERNGRTFLKVKAVILLFFLACVPMLTLGQDLISETEFQELSNEVRFEKTKKTWVLKERFIPKAKDRNVKDRIANDFSPNVTFANQLAVILGGILVVIILYFIFKNISFNRQVSIHADDIREDDIEAFMPETALDIALKNEDYRLAIRYRFLHVLKRINERGYIDWAFEKTNRDYLFEMRVHDQFMPFKKLTQVYEMIWYGNTQIDKTTYDYLDKDYEAFLALEL